MFSARRDQSYPVRFTRSGMSEPSEPACDRLLHDFKHVFQCLGVALLALTGTQQHVDKLRQTFQAQPQAFQLARLRTAQQNSRDDALHVMHASQYRRHVSADIILHEGADPIPANIDWEAWIGSAPMRPFKKDAYHRFKWRGVTDFGSGALGDMACHTTDGIYACKDYYFRICFYIHN